MNDQATLDAVSSVKEATHDPEVRVALRLEAGTVIQQGDVYLHKVADDHPRGEPVGEGKVQVALGSGIGSRHMAEGAISVFKGTTYPPNVRPALGVETLGPVVVATDTWVLTHPEHPHHRLPAGVYQTTYQADPRTMSRVVD